MGEITYRDRNAGKYDKNGKKKKQNWEYRFELAPVDGKRKWKEKSGFPRKQDAMAAAAIAYSEYVNGGEVINVREISFSDVLDRWIEEYCKQQLADETVKNYEKRIRTHIKPALGAYRVGAVRYLLKNTDENIVSSAQNIVAYLQECGIDPERRSVYDIPDFCFFQFFGQAKL